jgi:hypothetical protein
MDKIEEKAASVSTAVLGVIAAGLAAGILDIFYAFVLGAIRGASPIRVLQAVASGVLGAEAFRAGPWTAVLGLVLHMAILVVAALVYFVVARRYQVVRRRYLVFGSVFGVGVYLVMNFVVLPLSAIPFTIAYPPEVVLQGFVSHALLVGLPIALFLRWFAFPRFGGSMAP